MQCIDKVDATEMPGSRAHLVLSLPEVVPRPNTAQAFRTAKNLPLALVSIRSLIGFSAGRAAQRLDLQTHEIRGLTLVDCLIASAVIFR